MGLQFHQRDNVINNTMPRFIFLLAISFVVANKNLFHFRRWKTNCLFTKEMHVNSRSRLQCATDCGKQGNFDVFRYKKEKCFCSDSNAGFVVGKAFTYTVYIRKKTLMVSTFLSLIIKVLLTISTTDVLRITFCSPAYILWVQ